jgi:hypothetical protein
MAKGASGLLFRFTNKGSNFFKGSTHKKREIADSPQYMSDAADDFFKKKFKWKARTENVLFCWGKRAEKNIKTNNHFIFPIGKFKYIWSPKVNDMFTIFSLFDRTDDDDYRYENEDPSIVDFKIEYVPKDILNSYTNKNFKKALSSDNEIMIGCEKYYAISNTTFEEINEIFNLDLKI